MMRSFASSAKNCVARMSLMPLLKEVESGM